MDFARSRRALDSLRQSVLATEPSLAIAACAVAGSAAAACALWLASRYLGWASDDRVANRAVVVCVGTAVPPNAGDNTQFREVVSLMGYSPATLSIVDKVIEKAGIETRHTVIADTPAEFVRCLVQSGPRARASIWEKEAPLLAIAAARAALARWHGGSASRITHVVTHSCTGFMAPGVDHHLIVALGLRSSTRKVGVHFAGCFGGFTALYVAKQIVEADSTGAAVVLVVCVEACTLHMSAVDQRVELVIGNTIFADGAGAAIVARADAAGVRSGGGAWVLGDMSSEVIPASEGAMTWRSGGAEDGGAFKMWLDRSIPEVLSRTFATRGLGLLRRVGITSPWRCAWALHPGGAAIIRAFRRAFDTLRIKGDGLEASLDVLRDNGNMSSEFVQSDGAVTTTCGTVLPTNA